jgi:porphobilinogen synthase
MYIGTDPNRATPRVRQLLYRDPLGHSDLCQVVLILDDKISTSTRAPTYHLADVANLCRRLRDAKVTNVKLFAQETEKTPTACRAMARDNLLCHAVQEFRARSPELFVAVETCLCPYTEGGTCGLHLKDGRVDVAGTRELFGNMAVLHAEMGADAVGPASMIVGTVAACRNALDSAGWEWVAVMPHMIFRSPFFSLYRSIMWTGDGNARDAFQLDPYHTKECLRAVQMVIEEGANSILLEPALFILDRIALIHQQASVPIGCFSVSGEYELLRYGAAGADQHSVGALEFCRAAKRAGADFIATYAALEVAELLARSKEAAAVCMNSDPNR